MATFDGHGPSKRFLFIAALFAAGIFILFGRLIYGQVLHAASTNGPVSWSEALVPYRGRITDSHGYVLAADEPRYTVKASPKDIPPESRQRVAERLSPLLHLPVEDILSKLRQGGSYSLLANDVPLSTWRDIEAMHLPAIDADLRPKRVYPEGRLAAQVLGIYTEFVDHPANFGVEEYYQRQLAGTPGQRWIGSGSPLNKTVLPRQGDDLFLTIDRSIQAMVEEKLGKAVNQLAASGGTVIVMEAKTGAVLAMASAPFYDPNRPGSYNAEAPFNPAISGYYDPGSVFKIVTMAAALDSGLVTPQSIYHDGGCITYANYTACNAGKGAYGDVTMIRAMELSLNTVMVYLSTKMGPQRFYEMVSKFGFGDLSGIDLANESKGRVKHPGDGEWTDTDLAANAFGQGIGVTPIQMVSATAVIANQGRLMKPYVVGRILTPNGESTVTQPKVVRQVISPETAKQMTDILVSVMEHGEAKGARVDGYRMAGKTGTAENPEGGHYGVYEPYDYFVGFAPAEDPVFVMLVKLDKPAGSPWASEVAAPLWRDIAIELCSLLNIPPDNVRLTNR